MRIQAHHVCTIAVMFSLVLPAAGMGQGPTSEMESASAEPAMHSMVMAGDLAYEPIEVPGFDSGMKIAVLHGDPMASSGDYTIRLSFPDGYRFPSHWHPKAEHLTVLSGTLLLAMGETTGPDSSLSAYEPGDFLYLPAEKPHYGGATGETRIQLHGEAPFEIILSEAAR